MCHIKKDTLYDKDHTEQEAGESGFGKIFPSTQANRQEESSEEEEDMPSEFISRRELEKGRLSRDEMKRMSVFKNYESGEPTCRLYVKNISKQVEEKDLKYIYGRYINTSSEEERNMFDIVLMKEGRMKGQAFIGLPTEKSAEKALRDTNGYVLHDKPLVVVSFTHFSSFLQDENVSRSPADGFRKPVSAGQWCAVVCGLGRIPCGVGVLDKAGSSIAHPEASLFRELGIYVSTYKRLAILLAMLQLALFGYTRHRTEPAHGSKGNHGPALHYQPGPALETESLTIFTFGRSLVKSSVT
ncbi:hypothetical protein NFI96_003664 [Prochilodus magdalenae]|nr:hypothetical protein NFI96_003664 [Prochilodus magdalenae]